MKNLHIHVSALAAAALFALGAPAIADHKANNPYVGTPVHGQDVSPDRTVMIDSGTRWVNVDGGETIRFISGGRSFDWLFDTNLYKPVVDLRQVAPPGVIDRSVKVYVGPDPSLKG